MFGRKRVNGDRWQRWLQNGRLATAAWLLVFAAYLGFRLANITAPELTNAFVTLTGIWIGNLGIAQSKKQTQVVQKVDDAVALVDHAVEKVDVAVTKVDDVVERVETGAIPVIHVEDDPTTKPLPRLYRPEGRTDE
jgi:hypothetical protein